jgi:hypothetical protein
MLLSSVDEAKLALGIAAADTSRDALAVQLLQGASAAIEKYCNRVFGRAVYDRPFNGNGMPDLPLQHRPVLTVPATGTVNGVLTNGSAVVTGLSSTAGILVGMPVMVGAASGSQAAVANGAKVLSVDSASQVTLTAPCTLSGTLPLTFGLCVWVDVAGYYGDGTSPWPVQTRLALGKEYSLLRDAADGSSRSGVLRRLLGGPTGYGFGAWPWSWPLVDRRGTLTARLAPSWPAGYGNVRVAYTAGYAEVPEDIKMACNLLMASVNRMRRLGAPLQSESYEGYSYSLFMQLKAGTELGEARQVLSRYREVAL